MEPLDVISSTADAAYATDQDGRIVMWNRSAERLFDRGAADVLGKACHEVVCGKDLFGNRFCTDLCAVNQMAQAGEPVHQFELDITSASGATVRAAFSIIVVPGPKPDRYTVYHILRPGSRGPEADELLRRVLQGSAVPANPAPNTRNQPTAARRSPLTAREMEILRLLADGRGTHEIATGLFISKVTVRTHVQNILRKLEVHSKLEAVALALRHNFL